MTLNDLTAEDQAFDQFCESNHINCSSWQTSRQDCTYKNTCRAQFFARNVEEATPVPHRRRQVM